MKQGFAGRGALVLIATFLGGGVAVATFLLVMYLRAHALTEATTELRGAALVLADQAERAFEGIELVQSGIVDQIRESGVRTPDAFRDRMATIESYQDLRGRVEGLPEVDAVTVIDAAGKLLNFTRFWPIPEVNVADRDYFKALGEGSELTRFFSKPVHNRGDGNWTTYVARRVAAPDGTFLGLVLGSVSLNYFERLYRQVGAGSDTSIALFLSDGTLLARYPHWDGRIGESFHQQAIFQQADDGDGLIRQTSLVDGEDRLYARHRLAHYPLMLTASNSLSAILAVWRAEAAVLIGGAGLMELAIAAAVVLLLRQFRHEAELHAAHAARAVAVAEAGQAQNARFGLAMSAMAQAICMFDAAGGLAVANRRVAEMLCVSEALVAPGTSFEALLSLASNGLRAAGLDGARVSGTLRHLKETGVPGTRITELADGRALALGFQPTPAQGFLLTIEDITDRRQVEAKIQHMAHHDALTGLPNRVLFHEKLTEAIARGSRGDPCAVFYLDLDHFKAVNDTLGHPIGDELLRQVTQRLLSELRETDFVARLGGDEFAIIQSAADQPTQATTLADRLIAALQAPFALDAHQVTIGTSIGIAVIPADGTDADLILKNADLALYGAKSDGRGRARFFEPAMGAVMQARRTMELDMRKALAAHEFEVFYQPLMNVTAQRVSAFEALIRWRHPARGMISPVDFIPLAEEIGLIVPIGKFVLRQACADAATWPGAVKVAVNLSPVQFGSRTLVEDVRQALADAGLAPGRLELEITETAMLSDTDATLAVLHRLRNLGVEIAMDDFGTGYSSLSYLRRFPFDKVKIDRSFVDGLGTGGDNEVIVRSVAELCEKLGMTTTAEGVETAEQLRLVTASGCTEVQGYLFSGPCPAAEVVALCARLDGNGSDNSSREDAMVDG